MQIERTYDEVKAAIEGGGGVPITSDLGAVDEGGWGLLHLAALRGDDNVARALVEAGARLDARTHLDFTPAQIAAQSHEFDLREYLENAAPFPPT